MGGFSINKQEQELINREWQKHLEFKDPDGFYCCHEQDAKHTTVIGEAYCIDANGNEFKQSQEEAQKQNDSITCEFCELCRKLLGKKRKVVK